MIEVVRRYRYVVQDRDRHGNLRTYLRRPGQPKLRLKAEPGTPAFDAEYRAALEAPPPAPPAPRDPTTAPGTVGALIAAYYGSTEYRRQLGERSRHVRRLILERFREEKGKDGRCHGERQAAGLPATFLERMKDAMADRPEAFNSLLKALRAVYQSGIRLGLVTANPAGQVAYLPTGNPDGFHTWTREEVAQFCAKHPPGSRARLALAVLYIFGVRRSDAIKLGRQHVRRDAGQPPRLAFRVTKGEARRPRDLVLPYPAEMDELIAITPTGDLTWLVTSEGKPWATADSFGNQFRDWCREAGLPNCSAHGLRKRRSADVALGGATEREMMDMFGWSSTRQPTRYTRAANQEQLAAQAFAKAEVSHLTADSARWDDTAPQGADSIGSKKVMVPRAGLNES